MISYEEVIKQQEDLYELCKDRENSDHELFSPNNFYGMSTILKNYTEKLEIIIKLNVLYLMVLFLMKIQFGHLKLISHYQSFSAIQNIDWRCTEIILRKLS